MAQNPYMVDPGNDYSSGLSGLSSALSGIRQNKLQQAEQDRLNQAQQLKQDQYDRANQRFQEVQGAAQQAFASKDPDQIAKLSIQYPEIAPMLKQTAGLQDDMKARDAMDFTRQFATASPEQRPALYQQRIQSILDRGGDPSHTIQSYQDYQKDPEGETNHVISYWAGIDPKGYGAFSSDQKQQQKQQFQQQQLGQQMTIAQMNSHDRALGRQISMLNAQQAGTMNDLKRQELQQKIQTQTQAQQDNKANAYNTANSAVATFDDTLANIDQIKSAPGLGGNFGKSSYIPNVRGGESANAQSMIDTLKGKAFLAAFNSLKGGGQITEVEGTKATNAMLNMENAQSEDQFRKNLAIFQGVIERGKKVAGQQASKYAAFAPQGSQQGAPAVQAPGAQQSSQAPAVTTQAQFNALPSGAIYTEDGQQYRKP